MSNYLTRVQQKIILDLIKQGGEAVSLFKLSVRIGSDYKNTRRAVNGLEESGMIETERSEGVSMRLRLSSGAKNPLFETIWGKQSAFSQTTNDKRQESGHD